MILPISRPRFPFLFLSAQQPDQIQEKVDKVEVEFQRRIDGGLIEQFLISFKGIIKVLRLFGIIGGDSEKDGDTGQTRCV